MAFNDSAQGAIIISGESLASIKMEGAVTKGDAVGFSSGWKRALASTGSVVQMRCVSAEDGLDGQTITAYFGGVIVEERFSGATVGGAIYVAEGTATGQYTQTAPDTTGDANKIVGYAIETDRLALNACLNNDSVA